MLRRVPTAFLTVLAGAVMFGLLFAGTPSTAVAGTNPTSECEALGMTFVTKLDGIPDPGGNGPHDFTGPTVEGPAAGGSATIQWTKNPDTLTIVSTTFAYDAYVEKRGEGGGLSHITFCEGEDPTETPVPPTATVPDPTATDPPATDPPATDPPATDPPATATLPPGVTPTVTNTPPPGATNTPAPTATIQVSVLPETGAEPGGSSGGTMLLLATVALCFGAAGTVIARTHRR